MLGPEEGGGRGKLAGCSPSVATSALCGKGQTSWHNSPPARVFLQALQDQMPAAWRFMENLPQKSHRYCKAGWGLV